MYVKIFKKNAKKITKYHAKYIGTLSDAVPVVEF